MSHWKPGLWPYSLLELLGLMEYCVCTWCLEAHRFCCQSLRDLGCHIDLGRGHLYFEKLGVRAEVTCKQSPHPLLPLTNFGPQGHKIPAEIQPHIISDECAIYGAACDSSSFKKYVRGSPTHRTTVHQKLTTPTQNPCMERMDQRRISAMKNETTGRTRRDDG